MKYGIIVETKMEQPLIWETKPLDYEEATNQARIFAQRTDVVRVVVFAIHYEIGNENLIEKE